MTEWKRKRGAYGTVELNRDARTATKVTRLFDAYDGRADPADPEDVHLISGNLREALFMHRLAREPLECVVSVQSVRVDSAGEIRAVMEMGDFSLHDMVFMLSFKARIQQFQGVFRDVLLGLCAMHDAGVVHGDVKPDNIVRVTDPASGARSFKLVDFGGICWYRAAPKHTSLCTYVTRAPELFDERIVPSPVSDAWSLGATMYFYCTRRYLVDDIRKARGGDSDDDGSSVNTMDFVAKQHEQGVRVKFPRGLPRPVKEMMRRLLDRDPAQRLSCRDCLVRYFGFQDAGSRVGEYEVDHTSDAARLVRLQGSFRSKREEEVLSRVQNMLTGCDELDCMSAVLGYVRSCGASLDDAGDADVRTLICAAHALARAIVYDEDTGVTQMDAATRGAIPALLRETGLAFPHELIKRSVRRRGMVVSVDGNIGSSKSTVLARLRARLGDAVCVVPEPVDDWAELLQLYYSDPSRWATALHTRILTSFFEASRRFQDGPPLLMERSAWSCMAVFQDMLLRDGVVTAAEHRALSAMYDAMADSVVPHVVVYLRCEPDTCMHRLRARGRACESDVSLDYLNRLHEQYESAMNRAAQSGVERVITVDTTRGSPAAVEQAVFKALADHVFAA